MEALTPKDELLELRDFSNIEVFTDYCNELASKRPKSIGYKSVDFKTNKACLIVNSGDWHLGNEFTRYEDWLNDLKTIKNNPNVYTILTGDYIDNYHRSSVGSGIYEQIIPIPEAKAMALEGMQLIQDKILGIFQGCHDDWVFKLNKEDLSRYFASKSGMGYWMGFKGSINIHIGDIKYKIFATHKIRRHTSANMNHGIKCIFKEVEEFDVGFAAHHHTPNIEISYIKERTVYTVRCSTYKITDRFGEKLNYQDSPNWTPCVLLEQDTKNIIPFKTLEEGIRMLELINKNEV